MSSKSLHWDLQIQGSSQCVLPTPPLMTSDPDIWSCIHAEVHRQPPHQTPTHSTDATTICIHTGETLDVEWWMDGQYEKGTLSCHQMTLLPANLHRCIRWREDNAFLLLLLPPNFISDMFGGSLSFQMSQLVPQLGVHDPFIRELGQLIRRQLEHQPHDQTLYIESLSLMLGIYLLEHYSESSLNLRENRQGLSARQIRQVKDYIDANLAAPIRLKDLAQLLGMSAFHFSRQFKEATEIPPYQFVMNTRLNRARELLQSQAELNISDIAFQCGFSNQSHFAYHFRKLEGVSPKKYRQSFE